MTPLRTRFRSAIAVALVVAVALGACGGATVDGEVSTSDPTSSDSSTTEPGQPDVTTDAGSPGDPGEPAGPGPGEPDGGTSTSAEARAVTVAVVDNRFEADNVRVKVGELVRWEWKTRTVHNVTGGPLKSGNKAKKGFVFTHTFTKPGTFEYRCTLHAGMDGVVKVT